MDARCSESVRKSLLIWMIVEDDIEMFVHQAGQSQIIIVVVVVRGGLPKPSSYSK